MKNKNTIKIIFVIISVIIVALVIILLVSCDKKSSKESINKTQGIEAT